MNSQQVKEELQEQLKFQDDIGSVIIDHDIAEFVTLRDEQVIISTFSLNQIGIVFQNFRLNVITLWG